MTDDGFAQSSDAGFTLLELLVTLALIAVIGTTMAVAVTQLRPMRTAQRHLEEREAAAAILDVVARDIRAATRLPLIDGGSSTSKLLIGTPQGLTFSAVVPTGFQRRALREVTYEATNSSGATRLLRTIRMRRFSQENQSSVPQVDELWVGDFTIQMRYLEISEVRGSVWQDSFDKLNSLPKAISISFMLGNERQREIARTLTLSGAAEN